MTAPVQAVAIAGLLASNAEVQQLPGKGTRLVVVLDSKPPVFASLDYPGAGAEHASYIAATTRAKTLQRGQLVLLRGRSLEISQHRGRPALRVVDLSALESAEGAPVQPHSQPKES